MCCKKPRDQKEVKKSKFMQRWGKHSSPYFKKTRPHASLPGRMRLFFVIRPRKDFPVIEIHVDEFFVIALLERVAEQAEEDIKNRPARTQAG